MSEERKVTPEGTTEPAAEPVQEAASPNTEGPAAEASAPTPKEPDAETAAQTANPSESMDDYTVELEASFRKVQEGDVLKGTVIGVSETEITLDLKYYTEGIIRLEDYNGNPDFRLKENVQIGDEISATVIRKDDGHGRILLSAKEATENLLWNKLNAYMEDKTNLTVKVSSVVKAGVVAYVDGVRGFIPASKVSLNYVENLDEFLGKEMEVRVITADTEKKRLVLSARDVLREKAEEERRNRISNVQVGFVTEGTVETIKPYGAFINLGDGLSGLVHVSQIADRRIKTPEDVLSVGDKVKVKVTAIKDGKLSLSMKSLNDIPAEAVEEETFKMPKTEEATTRLSSLFANIHLDGMNQKN